LVIQLTQYSIFLLLLHLAYRSIGSVKQVKTIHCLS
jgi:hypothetical protein